MNTFLDDIEQELSILILQRPENERQLAQDSTTLINAHREFSRALGCQDCEYCALQLLHTDFVLI